MELKSLSNDIVQLLGTLKTPVKCNDWSIQKAKITVVADGFRPILGRDLFDQLGITISQKPFPQLDVNNIDPPCAIKKSLAKEFPDLTSRIGKIKKSHGQFEISQKLSSNTSKRTKSTHTPPTESENWIKKTVKWRTYRKVKQLFWSIFHISDCHYGKKRTSQSK